MITSQEIVSCLTATGVPGDVIHTVDEFYSLPDEAWVKDMGARYADLVFKYLKLEPEAMDCDDSAMLCAALARMDHSRFNDPLLKLPQAQLTQPPQPSTLAFGFMLGWFERWGGHSVNLAIHRINNVLVPRLYEPQPLNGICLSTNGVDFSGVLRWSLVYI